MLCIFDMFSTLTRTANHTLPYGNFVPCDRRFRECIFIQPSISKISIIIEFSSHEGYSSTYSNLKLILAWF